METAARSQERLLKTTKVSVLERIQDFHIGSGEELTGKLAASSLVLVAGFSNGSLGQKIGGPTRTGGITLLEGPTESKLIPQNVVTVTLGRDADGAAGRGQITLGGSNTGKYGTNADKLVKVSRRAVRTSRNAIADTGNNRVLTMKGDVQFFHAFPGAFKCEEGIFGLPFDPTKIP